VRRNPFDAIATMHMRSGRSVDNRIETYFTLCGELERAKRNLLAPEELLELSLEGLIERPEDSLRSLCEFVGVEADREYVSLCSGKVLARPHASREEISWTRDQWGRVEREMRRFDFLEEYGPTPPPKSWRGGAVGGRGSTQPAPSPARR
jgi:hypothetical protein